MKNELEFLKKHISYADEDKELFDELLFSNGMDRCIEIYRNYVRIMQKDVVDVKELVMFLAYENELSSILFVILRVQENAVKAFLCNYFNNCSIQIEERPSNYSKTKYYFKIPVGHEKYIDIRTFNYKYGPVDYYDAIKTMDFGDINLIISHLDSRVIKEFSDNPYIIKELDETRKIRNYVYHHNLLYAIDKDDLEYGIAFILKNLHHDGLKQAFIDEINNFRFDRKYQVDEKIAISISGDLLDVALDRN